MNIVVMMPIHPWESSSSEVNTNQRDKEHIVEHNSARPESDQACTKSQIFGTTTVIAKVTISWSTIGFRLFHARCRVGCCCLFNPGHRKFAMSTLREFELFIYKYFSHVAPVQKMCVWRGGYGASRGKSRSRQFSQRRRGTVCRLPKLFAVRWNSQ